MSRDSPRSEFSREDETARTPYDDDERAAYRGNDRTLPGFLPFGWPAAFQRGTTDEVRREERYDEGYTDQRQRVDEDEGSWLDEGLITLTILVGVGLFLFPEPGTSALGIALIAVGVVAWLVDWAMS